MIQLLMPEEAAINLSKMSKYALILSEVLVYIKLTFLACEIDLETVADGTNTVLTAHNTTESSICYFDLHPAGIWCENDVGSTSMRRDDVASTLIRRHFGTKCPLGHVLVLPVYSYVLLNALSRIFEHDL